MDELKQKENTVWLNVTEHLVLVSGPMEDCEWYGSTRIIREEKLTDTATLLLIA